MPCGPFGWEMERSIFAQGRLEAAILEIPTHHWLKILTFVTRKMIKNTKTIVSDPLRGLRTWGKIKEMIDRVVKNTDKVFLIDIGPQVNRLYISKDDLDMVEIGDSLLVISGTGPDPIKIGNSKPKKQP